MLGRARYSKKVKKGMYQSRGYELQYAQFIFGRTQWSDDLKIGEQKIRTCIKKMLADNMISLTRHTMNFTIYEIVNYAKYNHPNYLGTQEFQDDDNQRLTNVQPTSNQRLTTNEEGIKKAKEGKENINAFFDELWKLYPRKEGKGGVKKTQIEKLHKIGIEEMTRAVNRYIKAKSGEEKKYLQMGSTFFNSGYVDYLDVNYHSDKPPDNTTIAW